jgi:hypothetical protein
MAHPYTSILLTENGIEDFFGLLKARERARSVSATSSRQGRVFSTFDKTWFAYFASFAMSTSSGATVIFRALTVIIINYFSALLE